MVESTEPETTPAGLESSLGLSPVQGVSEINPEYSDNRPVTLRRIPVDLLEVGDIVSVPKGASPPTDCTIVTGSSSFDESSLTGEPLLVSKYLGDDIFAGTINHGQAVNARVKKVAGESMIDDIVEVVREGQNKHAPIERIADRVTAYFVPAICGLAVCTWAVWLTVGLLEYIPNDYLDINEGGWYLWSLSFAIAVFVVACPCGIGLAAPCALHVGSGIASRHAILAKGGGEAFQEASLLDCVVFDKTGTLTQGVEPVITDEELLFQGDYAVRVIYLAARLLEESSSHPLARAIVSHCKEKPSINGQCNHAEEIAGKGTKGIIEVGGVIYEALIGNERFLNEHGAIGAGQYGEMLLTWKQQGKSVILFAIRSEEPSSVFGSEFTLTAIFATTDPIREEAPFVVRGLQSSGVDVWMITGDNITTATAVASQVGIPKDRVIAGVLPTEKVRSSKSPALTHFTNYLLQADKVVELQSIATTGPRSTFSTILDRLRCRPTPERRAIVAMVGDGINDAPALSMADVGIAIGTGSDVAKQSAKFILVSSDLIGLLTLIDLSRAVVRRVKFNFFWACMFNLVAIPLAAGVLYPFTPQRIRLEPVWAALAMAMS